MQTTPPLVPIALTPDHRRTEHNQNSEAQGTELSLKATRYEPTLAHQPLTVETHTTQPSDPTPQQPQASVPVTTRITM